MDLYPCSLSAHIPTSPLVTTFVPFAKSSTGHLKPSFNPYLPRRTEHNEAVVLGGWVKRFNLFNLFLFTVCL